MSQAQHAVAAESKSTTDSVVFLNRESSANADASKSLPPTTKSQTKAIPSPLKKSWYLKIRHKVGKFIKFIGPGFLVAVAYIDPGNYATDVAAGASYRFKLLFMILLSNIIAIFLQSLCIRLGTVTGMNLAEACKQFLPSYFNYFLYVLAEGAIIATDIAEVIGTAIALNILLKIPLVAGCALSIVDVFIILLFYNPTGMTMRALRIFEGFVILLVFGVVICFCYELSKIDASSTSVGEVFLGFLPSSALVQSQGLYQACGILGATVMPHSLYLGSGIVQSRLMDFDDKHPAHNSSPVTTSTSNNNNHNNNNHSNNTTPSSSSSNSPETIRTSLDSTPPPTKYRPSLSAINSCLTYSIIECALSLCLFALFINSAILIVAGATLSDNPDAAANADLFSIHDLLSSQIAPVAGTLFALALLLSGTSAGIVCTIAGQIVAEGHLALDALAARYALQTSQSASPSPSQSQSQSQSQPQTQPQPLLHPLLPKAKLSLLHLLTTPWSRRLLTRSISIVPSIAVAGAVGRSGLSRALQGSQVALSVVLPVVSGPLIWFACSGKVMRVVARDGPAAGRGGAGRDGDGDVTGDGGERVVVMKVGWVMGVVVALMWLLITVMNVALLVLLALGRDV